MKKFAQVLNGKLHWKFEQDKAPDFAEDIQIVEITGITPEPQEGWWWDGQAFIAPLVQTPEELLAQAKQGGLARIDGYSSRQRAVIAKTTDAIEIAGWSNKKMIALAIQAGTASGTEIAAFEREISDRGKGETLDSFVAKVLVNAATFTLATGMIDGIKRNAQDAVNAASTPEDVDIALATAKEKAEAAFAQLIGAA